MQGIEFVKDLCCNYLTIPYVGKTEDFELRMMTENAAESFLPMEVRRLDGQSSLYYNISGMQNMEILYGEKLIERKIFYDLMWQVHEAIEESRELFLAGDGICLEPKFVFWEWETRRWKFIYIPGREAHDSEEARGERENLAEFLVMHIDYEDKELTDTAYQFYEEVSAGVNFPWGNFIHKMYVSEAEQQKRDAGFSETEDVETEIAGAVNEEVKEEIETADTHKRGKWKAIWGILLCAAAAMTLVSGRIMPGIMRYGSAMSAFFAAALFLTLAKERKQNDGFEQEMCEADLIAGAESGEGFYKIAEGEEEYGEKQAIEEERTVYIDMQSRPERKLYGVGKYRREKISLERLPCLVGKDKMLTDYVITDSSVSRMHAKFSLEGETLWMQDLNSTNGTYHNGMRLAPNEKVALEPEDEIRFGQAEFVFR